MAEQKQMHTAALLSFLPFHSGDGYAFGGGAVITVNGLSISLGEGKQAEATAKQIVLRWNSHDNMLAALHKVVDWLETEFEGQDASEIAQRHSGLEEARAAIRRATGAEV